MTCDIQYPAQVSRNKQMYFEGVVLAGVGAVGSGAAFLIVYQAKHLLRSLFNSVVFIVWVRGFQITLGFVLIIVCI